jgi:hypothetical protein
MAYRNMDDELERYKKLLGDWKQASQAVPRPEVSERPAERHVLESVGTLRPQAAPNRRPERPTAGSAEAGFSSGSILCLDDVELVVFRRPVAGKPLDMVYSLLADGAAKIDAVDLSQHRVEEIGQLPPGELKTLQAEMRWSRDLLAPHCFCPEDSDRIPDPGSAGNGNATPAPEAGPTRVGRAHTDTVDSTIREESAVRVEDEPKPQGKLTVRRGQKLSIKFGDRIWEAVYWGRDSKGSVVAHNTHNHWSLMHLNLGQYKDSMTITAQPDPLLIEQIGLDLSTQQRDTGA